MEITLPDGSTRKLGNNMPVQGACRAFPVMGETPAARLIPRSEWDGLLREYTPGPDHVFVPPVHDQNGIGQCNADTATAVLEFIRAAQGLPYVQLSAADLYHRINGGQDNGSLLEDAMHELLTNGVGTAATSGTQWKRGLWKGPAPASERARFRALEVYTCPTFAHCFSAVFQGFALSSGIMWYDSYTPDADGWLPGPGGNAGGHAIFGYKPTKRGSSYGIWHQNSWGVQWGLNGRFVIPETAYTGPVGGWYAVRAVVDEGGMVPQEG